MCRWVVKLVPSIDTSFSPACFSIHNETMNTYKSKNFYLSAFLEASGVPLVSHERWNGRTTFEFAQIDGLEQLISEYFSDTVKVSPIRFGNSLKNLKALIYSSNTNTDGNELTHSIRTSR